MSMSRGYKTAAIKPPRMPHSLAPARANVSRSHAPANSGPTLAGTSGARRNLSSTAAGAVTRRATSTLSNTRAGAGFAAGLSAANSLAPNSYTYGVGAGARRYRAYGYGQGYRNRYYGRRYGYGRSQGNNRAIVGRLRSVHATLARLDHDYQGHRVRAMHSISMAIRQLTHRSMVYRGVGFAPRMNMNNALAMGARRGGLGAANGLGARRGQRMPQAQSDAIMSQALRNLQGINMQLSSQGFHNMGHARARGHVQRAVQHLAVALRIR
jgi:hypothetical protein